MLTIAIWSGWAKQDKLVQVYSKLGGQRVGRISISKSLSMFDVVEDLCKQASKMMPHESLSVRNLALWVGSLRLTPLGFEFKESFTKQEEQEASELLEKARRVERVDMMWDDNYDYACQVLVDHDMPLDTNDQGVIDVHIGDRNTAIPPEAAAWFRRHKVPQVVFRASRQVVRDMAFLESMQGVQVGLYLVQPTVWHQNLVSLTYNGFSLGRSMPHGIGRCTELRLAYLQHVEVLPEDFVNLKLRQAVFTNCDAHDIAKKVCNMQSLEYLIIERSGAKPTLIPTSLGHLSSLKTLRLTYNNFTGAIPTEFGSLQSLTTLEVAERLDIDLTLPSEVLAINIQDLDVRST